MIVWYVTLINTSTSGLDRFQGASAHLSRRVRGHNFRALSVPLTPILRALVGVLSEPQRRCQERR